MQALPTVTCIWFGTATMALLGLALSSISSMPAKIG
jgi:hypothetical protein